MKKFLFVLLLLFLAPFFLADSIEGFKLPSNVPLNQGITASGIYVDSSPEGVLCSFYFFNSDGTPITRASDQYTDSSGRFFLPSFPINEPIFQRYLDYNLTVVCGTASETNIFNVSQRQEFLTGVPIYPQAMPLDLLYWADEENSIALVWFLIIIGTISFIIIMFKKGYLTWHN